jgi:hypothetical protein
MSAVVKVTAVKKFNRETLKTKWILDAVQYMGELKLFNLIKQQQYHDATDLAETIFDNFNDGCEPDNWTTPKDAVDEELTYWG